MNFLKNKTILITGGTGTFGNEVTKFILNNIKVKKLIIFSRDENKQYEMSKKFSKKRNIRFLIGDIRDQNRLMTAFRGVDYVIHAAAMKHVPASEYNPIECIKTNIDGSDSVINAAIERKVKRVIALSTDKACNPVNLYGATKLCSEKLFVNANQYSNETKFSVVRYGNVIGSRGSVIPFFQSLLKQKKTLPITSKDMTRFFIPISDSVKFVLNRLNDSYGGEIFIPKMNSIKLIDLIKLLDKAAKITIIGIRPGEKIHESLFSLDEARSVNQFKTFFVIYSDHIFYKKKYGKKLTKEKAYISSNKELLNINKIKYFLKSYLREI
tara:strand:- start:9262 stop:10236 length:975 start_codon:yes stop_codon:yes gene_type:complete